VLNACIGNYCPNTLLVSLKHGPFFQPYRPWLCCIHFLTIDYDLGFKLIMLLLSYPREDPNISFILHITSQRLSKGIESWVFFMVRLESELKDYVKDKSL